MPAELFAIAAAVIGALALIRFFPEETRRWFKRIRKARMVVFGIFGVLVALAFISSGSPLLMLVGGLMLLYGVLWLIFDDVLDSVLELLPV